MLGLREVCRSHRPLCFVCVRFAGARDPYNRLACGSTSYEINIHDKSHDSSSNILRDNALKKKNHFYSLLFLREVILALHKKVSIKNASSSKLNIN